MYNILKIMDNQESERRLSEYAILVLQKNRALILFFCVGHHQTCGGPVSSRREILFQMLRPQTGPLTVQGVVLAPQQFVHVPGQTEVRVVSPPRGMEVTAHKLSV